LIESAVNGSDDTSSPPSGVREVLVTASFTSSWTVSRRGGPESNTRVAMTEGKAGMGQSLRTLAAMTMRWISEVPS